MIALCFAGGVGDSLVIDRYSVYRTDDRWPMVYHTLTQFTSGQLHFISSRLYRGLRALGLLVKPSRSPHTRSALRGGGRDGAEGQTKRSRRSRPKTDPSASPSTLRQKIRHAPKLVCRSARDLLSAKGSAPVRKRSPAVR